MEHVQMFHKMWKNYLLRTIQYNTIQILLSTPHGGFSETNINSTGNQKNKQTKKYPRIVNTQLLRNYLHIDLRHHKLIINKLLRNYLHINLWHYFVAVGAMAAKKCNKKCAKLLLFLLNILLLTVPRVPAVVAYTP